jgi:prepilin-type N-terminal cleavage/methylation domain-containing protein
MRGHKPAGRRESGTMKINKKGFSMAELLAVIAIMAILAAVSSPFIRDYMKAAANDRAKVALQLIAQGYRTYKTDFPGSSMSGEITAPGSCSCSKADLSPAPDNNAATSALVCCNYIKNVAFSTFSSKYTFKVNVDCGSKNDGKGALACLQGKGSGTYGTSYYAWVNQYGELHDISE